MDIAKNTVSSKNQVKEYEKENGSIPVDEESLYKK